MRRLFIFVLLLVSLAAVYKLSQISKSWHYVLPAKPGELLYTAAFEDSSADWQQYEGRLSSQVANGVIRLTLMLDSQLTYSIANPYFGDFDIRADSRVIEGVFDGMNENAYGIIFRRKDPDNYYIFQVSSDGSYRIKRMLDGEPKSLSDWVTTSAIHQETGSINHLRVIGYQDQFQFYINNELMSVCIPDNPDAISTIYLGECMEGQMLTILTDDTISYGQLGVAAELARGQTTDVIVEFDNVVVLGHQPIE